NPIAGFQVKVSAAKVEVVSFRIHAGILGDLPFLGIRETLLQTPGDLLCDLSFQLPDRGCRSAERFAPELALVAHLYKLGADLELVASFDDPPGYHGLDPKGVRNLVKVDLFSLEFEG